MLKVKQIPWDDSLNILLLECIVQTGAHVPEWGKTEEVWEAVNKMFFNQSQASLLKESCYSSGNGRKLRDQYEKLKSEAQKSPAWPSFKERNKSAILEEEPNKSFCLLRRIEMEKEDKLELSKSKEADKLKLASLEKATITRDPTQPPPKKQRTKNVDGTIIGTITYSISIYYTKLIHIYRKQ